MSVRWVCSGPPSARWSTWRWTSTGCTRMALAQALEGAARHRQEGQVPLQHPELPQPGRRLADPGATHRRSSTSPRRADLLVVEDNPYGLLGFDGEPTPAMRSLEEDRVIYLGSFSKTFAPGFRVGWVLAPHAVREKLVLAQESATLCPPAFSQYAVTAYLANHDWRGQIKVFREMYRERRDAMLAGLADHMPAGTSWTVPARRVLRLGHAAARAGLARHARLGP